MMERRIELSLPAYLAGAWGIRERPVKGPKRGLSLGRIVDTAVSVADAEGLSAVSMSRVASELGASTMSLYRYVSSKDGLLLLMVDALYENPPSAPLPGDGWRDGLRRWAWEQRAVLRTHTWALYVPISGPPVTPHQISARRRARARPGRPGSVR